MSENFSRLDPNDEINLQSGNLSENHMRSTTFFILLPTEISDSILFLPSGNKFVRRSLTISSVSIVACRDLNRLVMDYLVIEGYKDAAQRFSVETGMSPQVDLESIENRMIIRSAIQRGDVEDAIGRVNELDPEVSLSRSSLPTPGMILYMHHAEED